MNHNPDWSTIKSVYSELVSRIEIVSQSDRKSIINIILPCRGNYYVLHLNKYIRVNEASRISPPLSAAIWPYHLVIHRFHGTRLLFGFCVKTRFGDTNLFKEVTRSLIIGLLCVDCWHWIVETETIIQSSGAEHTLSLQEKTESLLFSSSSSSGEWKTGIDFRKQNITIIQHPRQPEACAQVNCVHEPRRWMQL